MDLSRESTALSQKRCAEPYSYPKRPRSLYKQHQKALRLSIDTFNLNQLDLLADNSITYQQEVFSRVPAMDNDLIDADRDSIISLENDTFQIIRPASFSVNKPKALYRSKDSQSKFCVNSSQMHQQLAVQICQPIQFNEIEKLPVDLSVQENKPLVKPPKVKTSNRSTQTIDTELRHASTETDKVEREKSLSKSTKNEEQKNKADGAKKSKIDATNASDDTKSVDFDDKRILIEKKLELYYPFRIGVVLSVFLFLSSVVQIVLQLILMMDETPLNSVSAGVWSGFIGLMAFFSNILIIIKRKFKLFICSIILNCVGICVFIALAVINSICIRLYESCSTCSNLIGVNIVLMILAVVSFSVCFIFLIKIKIEIY